MVDEGLLRLMRSLLFEPEPTSQGIIPLREVHYAGSEEDRALGCKLIAEGRVGCLVVAGGQGTRLGFDGPKGMFPITPIQHKTLFQLLAEKVQAASEQAGRDLCLALMTSTDNDKATRDYFAKHQFFGLKSDQVFFFLQNALPFLDLMGNLIFLEDGTTLIGPDGNGGALEAFCAAGIAQVWMQNGVHWVNFIQIDNPLADPFDAGLVGYHIRTQREVTIKAVKRKSLTEKVGTIVQTTSGIRVVEYSELPEAQRKEHPFANISCFCFSMDFIQHAKVLQLHKALKRTKLGSEAWKFERFIFDVLAQAQEVGVLVYDRARCFAPLKNANGEDSPATVKAALLEADRCAYEAVAHLLPPEHPFEVHPKFYYPTPSLMEKWESRAVGLETYLC